MINHSSSLGPAGFVAEIRSPNCEWRRSDFNNEVEVGPDELISNIEMGARDAEGTQSLPLPLYYMIKVLSCNIKARKEIDGGPDYQRRGARIMG